MIIDILKKPHRRQKVCDIFCKLYRFLKSKKATGKQNKLFNFKTLNP